MITDDKIFSLPIQYLERNQIDSARWDNCIFHSFNGTIYCTSKYLDIMTANSWSAIVMGDYEIVLPLPRKKKWWIEYIYSPFFTQQMGIISLNKTDLILEEKIVSYIPEKFKHISINLNATNLISKNIIVRKNHILNLYRTYDDIRRDYSRSAKRNIAKANLNGITVTEKLNCKEVMKLHQMRFKNEIGLSENDYQKFLLLMSWMQQHQQGLAFGALDKHGKLIASSFYLLYKNRLTFILNGNLPESLETGATHLLKDYVIQKFSSQNLLMDFEGSNTASFARFYKQFGAI
jgi:hypothetical protein